MLIRTKNFTLRRFYLDDAPQFFSLTSNMEMKKYIPGIYTRNIDEALDHICTFSRCDEEKEFYLAIVKDEKIIGIISACEVLIPNVLDVSYYVAREYRHKGIMTEAMKLFMKELRSRKDIQITALELIIGKDNYSSIAVAKKIGSKIKTQKHKSDNITYRIEL